MKIHQKMSTRIHPKMSIKIHPKRGILKIVLENSPILFMKICLLCPGEFCHPSIGRRILVRNDSFNSRYQLLCSVSETKKLGKLTVRSPPKRREWALSLILKLNRVVDRGSWMNYFWKRRAMEETKGRFLSSVCKAFSTPPPLHTRRRKSWENSWCGARRSNGSELSL